MINSLLCTICGKRDHGICTSMKRVTSILEDLRKGTETVKEFCAVSVRGDKLKTSGECEAALTTTTTTRIWVKLGECGEALLGIFR